MIVYLVSNIVAKFIAKSTLNKSLNKKKLKLQRSKLIVLKMKYVTNWKKKNKNLANFPYQFIDLEKVINITSYSYIQVLKGDLNSKVRGELL